MRHHALLQSIASQIASWSACCISVMGFLHGHWTDIMLVRRVSCRQESGFLDSHSLPIDCHDWSGYCVLCDCGEEYAVSLPPHMSWMASGNMRSLWAVSLDCGVCSHPDDPFYGKPHGLAEALHFNGSPFKQCPCCSVTAPVHAAGSSALQ